MNNAFRVSEEAEGRSFTGDIVFQAPPHKNQGEFTKVATEYLGSAALLDDPVASPIPNAPVEAFARAAGALYVTESARAQVVKPVQQLTDITDC